MQLSLHSLLSQSRTIRATALLETWSLAAALVVLQRTRGHARASTSFGQHCRRQLAPADATQAATAAAGTGGRAAASRQPAGMGVEAACRPPAASSPACLPLLPEGNQLHALVLLPEI